ncbi:hypothetical protein ACFPN0_10445 [Kitasatospora cinereorecta]
MIRRYTHARRPPGSRWSFAAKASPEAAGSSAPSTISTVPSISTTSRVCPGAALACPCGITSTAVGAVRRVALRSRSLTNDDGTRHGTPPAEAVATQAAPSRSVRSVTSCSRRSGPRAGSCPVMTRRSAVRGRQGLRRRT